MVVSRLSIQCYKWLFHPLTTLTYLVLPPDDAILAYLWWVSLASFFSFHMVKSFWGVVQTAQWLRVYSALAEDPSSLSSIHARQLTIHNCL